MRTTQLCRYRYDALDQLIGRELFGQEKLQRFYRQEHLVTELQGQASQSVFQHDKQLLALQSRQGDERSRQLLATDQQRSVLQLVDSGGAVHQVYAPYGHRHADTGFGSLLGYNGEALDSVTGHYLLGNGHRAFNPVFMRFNSPDRLSPFGRGGLNPYAYCLGDPVNFSDPMGQTAEQNWQPWLILGVSALTLVSAGVGLFSARLSIKSSKIKSASPSAPLSKIARYAGMAGAVAGLIGGGAGLARSALLATDPDNSALDPLLITMAVFSALSFTASATSVSYNFRAYKMNRAEGIKLAYSGEKSGNYKNPMTAAPSAPPETPNTLSPSAPLPTPEGNGWSFNFPASANQKSDFLRSQLDRQLEIFRNAKNIRRNSI
jgi:RHS repeat-associated protein